MLLHRSFLELRGFAGCSTCVIDVVKKKVVDTSMMFIRLSINLFHTSCDLSHIKCSKDESLKNETCRARTSLKKRSPKAT